MADALDEFRIEGINHNIDFLDAIMHNARFRSGALSTAFIAEEYPDGFHGRPLDAELDAPVRCCGAGDQADADEARQRNRGTLNGRTHRAGGSHRDGR